MLAFFAQASFKTEVFDWLLALSGLSGVLTWGSICAAHISFRWAYRCQGRDLEDDYVLPFLSPFGTIGSYVGLSMNLAIIGMQFISAITPVGYRSMSPAKRASNFFQSFMAFIIFFLIYIGFKFKFRKGGWKLEFRTVWKHPGLKQEPDKCACRSDLPHIADSQANNNIFLRGIVDPTSSSLTQRCPFIYLDELLPPAEQADDVPEEAEEENGSFEGRKDTLDGTGISESIVEPDEYRMNWIEKWIAIKAQKINEVFAFPWS